MNEKISKSVFHQAVLRFLHDIPKQDIKVDKNGKITNWSHLDEETKNDIRKHYD